MACPVAGVPHPALLVVHAAWVAVEAVEVELLLAGGRQILGPPAAHQLLRRQLLLRAQLPLEGRPGRDAQRRQALGIPAASTPVKAITSESDLSHAAASARRLLWRHPDGMPTVLCEAPLPELFVTHDLLFYIDLLFKHGTKRAQGSRIHRRCFETLTCDWVITIGCQGGQSDTPLRIAQLLHGQLLLQTDLLLLLQGEVVKAATYPSWQGFRPCLPGLMPAPGALEGFAAQILPAQAHDCPHSLGMRGILRRHTRQLQHLHQASEPGAQHCRGTFWSAGLAAQRSMSLCLPQHRCVHIRMHIQPADLCKCVASLSVYLDI